MLVSALANSNVLEFTGAAPRDFSAFVVDET
jgi:hypothetical protein